MIVMIVMRGRAWAAAAPRGVEGDVVPPAA
jgi:hypothetical protein